MVDCREWFVECEPDQDDRQDRFLAGRVRAGAAIAEARCGCTDADISRASGYRFRVR